jgi:hypothetical protein
LGRAIGLLIPAAESSFKDRSCFYSGGLLKVLVKVRGLLKALVKVQAELGAAQQPEGAA